MRKGLRRLRQKIFRALKIKSGWEFLAFLGIWLGVVCVVVGLYFTYDLPDVGNITAPTRRPTVTLMDTNNRLITRYGDVVGKRVNVPDLPPHVVQAVMAAEDRRFYDHFGADVWGILRAFYHNIRAGRVVQGGSTITQQLAKNLFLKPDRTLRRKVQEMIMALWLEGQFTKDQILSAYLNRVYLGAGTYGYDGAAHVYFGHGAKKLTLPQAAVMAGLLKAPSRYSPASNPDAARARARVVLKSMQDAGYISAEQFVKAEEELAALTFSGMAVDARYFAAYAVAETYAQVGALAEDLVVTTTLNLDWQRAAEKQISATLDANEDKAKVSQAGLLLLSHDGAVRAYVGGRDYDDSEYDRVTQAQRQPGSAFKPFVYLAALEQGLAPDQMFDDAPQSYGRYRPQNYTGKYLGPVSAAQALAESLNTVAVQVAYQYGIGNVVRVARQLGITTPLARDLSLALGSSEVSLMELTAAYAGMAAGGQKISPYVLQQIKNGQGKILYQRQGPPPSPQVLSAAATAKLVRMMQGVIAYGTGQRANIGVPVAGKTGTTQDYRDAWFIGFTAHATLGVWMGNDDNTPMQRITGGSLPASIWRGVMQGVEKNFAPADLPALNGDAFFNQLFGPSPEPESRHAPSTPFPQGTVLPRTLAPPSNPDVQGPTREQLLREEDMMEQEQEQAPQDDDIGKFLEQMF